MDVAWWNHWWKEETGEPRDNPHTRCLVHHKGHMVRARFAPTAPSTRGEHSNHRSTTALCVERNKHASNLLKQQKWRGCFNNSNSNLLQQTVMRGGLLLLKYFWVFILLHLCCGLFATKSHYVPRLFWRKLLFANSHSFTTDVSGDLTN